MSDKVTLKKQRVIKKSDIKYILIFIVILIAAFIAGFGTSIFLCAIEDNIITNIGLAVEDVITNISLYFNFILTPVSILITLAISIWAKKSYLKWDGEDEEKINKIETMLNISLILSTVNQIFILVFMPIAWSTLLKEGSGKTELETAIPTIAFVVTEIYVLVSQYTTVNFVKKINPEKNGCVFDINFSKKWMQSMDEAEKLKTFEASYISYKTVNVVCMILCIFSFIGMLEWDFGVAPVCMVGIIWFASTMTYSIKAIMLEQNR